MTEGNLAFELVAEADARVRDNDQGKLTFCLASITLFGGMLGTACALERASDEDMAKKARENAPAV